jgi:hypothetical protein
MKATHMKRRTDHQMERDPTVERKKKNRPAHSHSQYLALLDVVCPHCLIPPRSGTGDGRDLRRQRWCRTAAKWVGFRLDGARISGRRRRWRELIGMGTSHSSTWRGGGTGVAGGAAMGTGCIEHTGASGEVWVADESDPYLGGGLDES